MVRHDPRQLDLLRLLDFPAPAPEGPGSLASAGKVRELVTAMVKGCPWSRVQIAEKMSLLTGQKITLEMLNTWTAESRRQHRFPLEFAPALERVTGSRTISEHLVALSGGEVYWGADALKARVGKLEMEKAHLAETIKNLKKAAS